MSASSDADVIKARALLCSKGYRVISPTADEDAKQKSKQDARTSPALAGSCNPPPVKANVTTTATVTSTVGPILAEYLKIVGAAGDGKRADAMGIMQATFQFLLPRLRPNQYRALDAKEPPEWKADFLVRIKYGHQPITALAVVGIKSSDTADMARATAYLQVIEEWKRDKQLKPVKDRNFKVEPVLNAPVAFRNHDTLKAVGEILSGSTKTLAEWGVTDESDLSLAYSGGLCSGENPDASLGYVIMAIVAKHADDEDDIVDWIAAAYGLTIECKAVAELVTRLAVLGIIKSDAWPVILVTDKTAANK